MKDIQLSWKIFRMTLFIGIIQTCSCLTLVDNHKAVRITAIALPGRAMLSVANVSSKAAQETMTPVRETWGKG